MGNLYINQNGRVVCVRHGGGYLASVVSARPNVQNFDTPLDNWERIPPAESAIFGVTCEDCP